MQSQVCNKFCAEILPVIWRIFKTLLPGFPVQTEYLSANSPIAPLFWGNPSAKYNEERGLSKDSHASNYAIESALRLGKVGNCALTA